MTVMMQFLAENSYSLMGASSALCGVALLSLVMGRTAARRREQREQGAG